MRFAASPALTRAAYILAATLLPVVPAFSQSVSPRVYEGMEWRNIGPARGGRSLAVAGSVQRPKEYFFGATGGGVWKTTDGGKEWNCVSDGFFTTASVGALAVAPSNPDVVYAGTGERDIRGNISHGDGVYRSDDAGKTWTHIGLEDTQTISRLVVDPRDPKVVYAAALGHIYGFTGRRGIFKSTDAGRTWEMILPGFPKAGAVDLAIDVKNPDVLLAATWEAWRTPYSLNSGGDGSRLFKSTNGGKAWSDISRNPGLPAGTLGKIGVTISPADPNRYFAIVENLDGGIFRSDDAGATWTRVNDSRNWRQRAWYFSHVYADPKNRDGLYVLNVGMGKSTDGGKTFKGLNPPHGDNHDLWIAPDDPDRFIQANDGGATVSTDGGKTWTELDVPTAQFYHVTTDNAFPYRILGAQQDNSTVRIPSRNPGGITATSWTDTAGGESGYIAVKPNDPDVVYGGSYGGDLSMRNHRTGLSRAVDPWPDNPMGAGAADLEHRFQWTYPIVFSPNDPNLLYTCSQYVMSTRNGGQSWDKISPDLTRNDKTRMQSSGGPITKDNTSVEYYGTVFTLAESPRQRGLLWAGSDDGLIHIRRDGKWINVTPRAIPTWSLVSIIEASPVAAGTAFAAVDNHENDDLRPYLYRTDDFGATWKSITNGLPVNSFVRTVRQDPVNPNLLFCGTETGVHISFNGGQNWQPLRMNLPVTPVHDLVIKDNDLIAATHGRSFWVLDDISPLRQAALAYLGAPVLFKPVDAYRVQWGGRTTGVGANPLSGIVANYYLPTDAKAVKVEVLDKGGKVVGTARSAGSRAGFNRTSVWLQEESYRMGEGMIFWAGFPSRIDLPPGLYTLRLTVDGAVKTEPVRLKRDPRLEATDADLVEQYKFQRKIADRVQEANDAVAEIRKLRATLMEKTDPTPAESARIAALTEVEEAIYQTKVKSGQDPLNYPIRLNNKLAALFNVVGSGEWKPTRQSYQVYEQLSRQLQVQLDRLAKLR